MYGQQHSSIHAFKAWMAGHFPQFQQTLCGVWTAAVVWLAMLMCLEALITGRIPAWLKDHSNTSTSLWLSWVAVGACAWLTSAYFTSLRQAAMGPTIMRQGPQAGMAELQPGNGSGRKSRRSTADYSTAQSPRQSQPSSVGHSLATSAHTSFEAAGYHWDSSSSGWPRLERRPPKHLRQARAVAGGTAEALIAVAGLRPQNGTSAAAAAAAAAPVASIGLKSASSSGTTSPTGAASRSCMQRLRRLSMRTPSQAYSEVPSHQGNTLVLYVDSSPIDQAVLAVLLGNEPGFELVTASSGLQALQMVFNTQWLPDIVLMDVLLPDMKTSEVCSQLRSLYSPVELPIVLLSSRSGEADMLAALEGGVNDFLIKPLRRLELMARINSQMMIKQSVRREAESRSHYELLVQVLPPHIIQRLAVGQAYIPEKHEEVTILFSDIVGFTELCALWPTQEVVAMLDMMFSSFDDLCDRHNVFKVETIGDAYMVVAGHDGSTDHTLRMAAMAVDMLAAAEDIQHQLMAQGKDGRRVQIRIGMHTGPAHSGVVGKRRPRYCFFGDTVNTASRMESSGYPMTIHLSDGCVQSMKAAAAQAARASCDAVQNALPQPAAAASSGSSSSSSSRSLNPDRQAGPDSSSNSSSSGSSYLPWELLDMGTRHVKGKGRMKTHLLKVGEWHAALCSQRTKQLQQAYDSFNDSSTCSTSSPVSPLSLRQVELQYGAFASRDNSLFYEEASFSPTTEQQISTHYMLSSCLSYSSTRVGAGVGGVSSGGALSGVAGVQGSGEFESFPNVPSAMPVISQLLGQLQH